MKKKTHNIYIIWKHRIKNIIHIESKYKANNKKKNIQWKMKKDNKIQMLTEPLSQLSIVAHTSNEIKSLTRTNNIILLLFFFSKTCASSGNKWNLFAFQFAVVANIKQLLNRRSTEKWNLVTNENVWKMKNIISTELLKPSWDDRTLEQTNTAFSKAMR